MENLDLVPTQDLIVALLTRFDAAVFAGVRIRTDLPETKDGPVIDTVRRWHGNTFTCVGLATDISLVSLSTMHTEDKQIAISEM